ncbi:MAG: nickel pincer cofactor biosynthesis protein LarB [Thermoguttaceae bacterium]
MHENNMHENSHKNMVDLGNVQHDLGRENRCGFPEVIYGEGKTKETILHIFHSMAINGIDGFATRIDEEKGRFLEEHLRKDGHFVRWNQTARTFRLLKKEDDLDETKQSKIVDETEYNKSTSNHGLIAILSAGTSDAPVAEEARETALWSGANVLFIQDVGVAGPHRLHAKLPQIREADVVIVVAGMEGALPSVVGGFVSVPVIAVPTSVGYGASFGGLAALLGMLNSCASNVTVVNIDAGFKAGYVAGLIVKNKNAQISNQNK